MSVVKLDQVHRKYKLGSTYVHALRGVDFLLEKGEFAALVGTSGSGKSTLLNMVGCIDSPDEGNVYINSISVKGMSENDKSKMRNEYIGFVFQNFNLIPVLNVFENIELPLLIHQKIDKKEHRERIMQAMVDVGLEEFKNHLPDKLSGGQRQRVSIARALVASPLLVLADEPTANLDSQTAHKIIDLMRDLNAKKNITFLFSTHDEKLMTRVDRIVRLCDGAIVS